MKESGLLPLQSPSPSESGASQLLPESGEESLSTWRVGELFTQTIYLAGGYCNPLKVTNAAVNCLFDQGASWKEKRYVAYYERLAKKLEGVSELSSGMLHEEFQSAQTIQRPARKCYHAFLQRMRNTIVEVLASDPDQGDGGIYRACVEWFSAIEIGDNLLAILSELAEKGQQALDLPPLSQELKGRALSSKVAAILYALDNTPSEYLAPWAHLALAKTWKCTSYFDGLAYTNMPWQYCRQYYWRGSAQREVINIRVGVPISHSLGYAGEFSVAHMAVVPEYFAFVKGLQQGGKKLTLFLHLDSTSLSSHLSGNSIEYEASYNSHPLKYNEAIWAAILLQLQKQFPETVTVCSLPFDGEWKRDLLEREGGSASDFCEVLLARLLLGPDNYFVFPDLLHYSKEERKEMKQQCQGGAEGVQSSSTEEIRSRTAQFFDAKQRGDISAMGEQPLYRFLKRILDAIAVDYFSHYKETVLTVENKRAFYGIFLTHLQEEIQEELESDIVQNNCTDGIDRTAEIMGAKLAIALARDNRFDDLSAHDQYIAQVLTPALAIWKRPILPGRREIFPAVLCHLEQMRTMGLSIKVPPSWRGMAY